MSDKNYKNTYLNIIKSLSISDQKKLIRRIGCAAAGQIGGVPPPTAGGTPEGNTT